MTRLLCILLTLLFSLSGPALGANSDFSRSSFAANSAPRLALPAARGVNEWKGPIQSIVTDGETLMYRVHGGGSSQMGAWLTPFKPTSSAAARSGLALPEANAATHFSEVWVPAGTRLQIGTAAPAFGQAGGGVQVQLLERIPASSFGTPTPLR